MSVNPRSPVTVLVRNYNGKELLSQLLPGVVEAVSLRGCDDEIMVVDDGSQDGSVDFLRRRFPDVKVLRLEKNSGNTMKPLNYGILEAANDFVVVMDNDVLVNEDFITPLLSHFEEDVFAACPKIVNPLHGNTIESVNYPLFRRGRWVGMVPGRIDPSLIPNDLTEIWYAPASCVCYHRPKFTALNGWDALFRPIYMEDVDICHRAWRRGWRTLYVPFAVINHLQHVTTQKHRLKTQREFLLHRTKNTFLFTWKNLFHQRLLLLHFLWIPLHLFHSWIKSDAVYSTALLYALKRFKEAAARRRGEKQQVKRSDQEIFQRFAGLHIHSSPFRQNPRMPAGASSKFQIDPDTNS